MIEVVKHVLGLCGEHFHPNLLNLSALSLGLTGTISYIKYKLNYKIKKDDK
jgi:hypothetical protein